MMKLNILPEEREFIVILCCIVSAWNSVSRELDMCHNQPHSNSSNYRNGASVTYYQEREPNPQLKGNNIKQFIINHLYLITLLAYLYIIVVINFFIILFS